MSHSSAATTASYRDLVDRDIVWHEPGDTQISGDWFGADEGLRMYQKFMEISGGTYRDELIDIVANDRHRGRYCSPSPRT